MRLCRPVPLTSKAMLLPFLREHFLAAEPRHEVLATSFEFRADEGVDVLALAPDGRLVAVLAHVSEPGAVVDELLRRLHWMIDNAPLMQRLFPAVDIDLTRPPRLALVVPRLESRLRDVLRYFTATELTVYEYRLVEFEGEIALLIDVAARFPHVEERARPAALETPHTGSASRPVPARFAMTTPEPLFDEAEAELDELVARHDEAPISLIDDENVEIHVDDMNVEELGVSEEELLDLLNIHVPGRDPGR
ncbi:MAG: hypothetical protein JW889_10385 [Verrucomicrobia bacterium]|nr:hypothetical protein [Verrucomicrobiota bacterium]